MKKELSREEPASRGAEMDPTFHTNDRRGELSHTISSADALCCCDYYSVSYGPLGRGLFAKMDIDPFTHIHTAPCILVPKAEYDSHMKHTILEHYLFNCPGKGDRLLALGHGSLFNHDSNAPNVDYRLNKAALVIRYYTGYRGAKKGDELCIFYGENLWFKDNDRVAGHGGNIEQATEQLSGTIANSSFSDDDDEVEDDDMAIIMSRIEL